MPVNAKLESFNVTLDAATTTHAHTGYGFAVRALLGFAFGRTESTSTFGAQSHKRTVGVAAGATARGLASSQSENGVGTSNSDQGARTDAFLARISTAGAWSGLLDINSLDADGWTDVIDLQFNTNGRAHVLSLGGDITAQFVSVTEPAATGNQTISGLSGTPSAILCVHSPGGVSPPTIVTDSRFMFGVAVNANGTIKNAVYGGGSNNGDATTVTRSYCRAGAGTAGDFIASLANDHLSLTSRARVTSMSAGQFVINWAAVIGDQARDYLCIVLYGGLHDIGTFSTLSNTTTPINITGLNQDMRPVAGVFVSASDTAFSTENVLDVKDELSFGSFAWNTGGTLEQGCQAMRDANGVATTDVSDLVNFSNVYANLSAGGTLDALMQVTGRSAGTLTMQMTDAEPPAFSAVGWAYVAGESTKGLRRIPMNLDGLGTYRTDPCGV